MITAGHGVSALTAASPWPVLPAPAHWRRLDFISDLHLGANTAATFKTWQTFMQTTRADAVFILGDLFEVWVGDDVLGGAIQTDARPGFETRCVQVLNAASQRLNVFLMHGNRDFLLGTVFAKACNLTLIDDPTVLEFSGQRWLLSHGDALCLADTDYIQFRDQVHRAAWQRDFLAQPLSERKKIARSLRSQSEAHKRSAASYADLDAQASRNWLSAAQANTLIHGHTHRPASHDLSNGLQRIVLSDWDADVTPPRAEVLRLSAALSGQAQDTTVQRLSTAQAAD